VAIACAERWGDTGRLKDSGFIVARTSGGIRAAEAVSAGGVPRSLDETREGVRGVEDRE
jgi:hypothetical protein